MNGELYALAALTR